MTDIVEPIMSAPGSAAHEAAKQIADTLLPSGNDSNSSDSAAKSGDGKEGEKKDDSE